MPIRVIAKIKQANDAAFSLLDDVDLKGGFRVVNSVPDLSLIPADFLKLGMLAKVGGSNILYELTVLSPITWEPFVASSGSASLVFADESDLLSTTTGIIDGETAYARLEGTFWIWDNTLIPPSKWRILTNQLITYTTEIALLADSPVDGTLGIAEDNSRIYFRTGGMWTVPNFSETDGGFF